MDCTEARDLLERYADGEVDDATARQVNLHLATCSRCRMMMDELEELTALILSDAVEPPPSALSDSILASASGTLHEYSLNPSSWDECAAVDVQAILGDDGGSCQRRLGPYEIENVLGRGSMGVVYRGLDRNLDRPVAIKEISPSLASDESVVKRFIREARLVASLHHENICAVYFMDVAGDTGTPFIAMEYVAGRTLQQAVKDDGPLAVPRAVLVIRQVAMALHEAQTKGIVHRDVKPANILLTAEDRVKVTDFGLAKALGIDAPLTVAGSLVGTPHFMSPEAARGAHCDFRSDMYSLGLTLFFTLTGRLPYATTNIARVLEAKQFAPAPDVAEFRDDLPQLLVDVVSRLLAKLPAERYATFADVVTALDGSLP